MAVLAAFAATNINIHAGARDLPRHPRDYYLDSHHGSDQADGTQSHPWQSLAPLNQLTFVPGDTILFARGSEFTGGVQVQQSGAASSPITFKSTGQGPAPRFTNPHLQTLNGNALRISGSYVIIDGLSFSNCPTNPVEADVYKLGAIFLTTDANHCIVQNCEITQTPIGIAVYGQHNLISHNFIHDNNQPILSHWGPIGIAVCNSHNDIDGNRILNYCAPSKEYGHDGGAIEINDSSLPKEDIHIHNNLSLRNQGFIEFVGHVKQDNLRIDHNVCADYQSFLGFTGPCTNILVDHNTVVRTLVHEQDDSEDVVFWNYTDGGDNTNIELRNNIFVYGPRIEPIFSRGEFQHNNNLFYRIDADTIPLQANHAAYIRKYLGGGARLRTGDKIGDPLFRNPAASDYHLLLNSPALSAGQDLGYTQDFDGRPLPKDAAPDLGAFQSQAK